MARKKIVLFFVVSCAILFLDDTHLEVPVHQVHLPDAVFHLLPGADHHLHGRVLSDHL